MELAVRERLNWSTQFIEGSFSQRKSAKMTHHPFDSTQVLLTASWDRTAATQVPDMIKQITAYSVCDSRGNPTVAVVLRTDRGDFESKVPSGASTGVHEALELRDNDPKKLHGKSVNKAIHNVNSIIGPLLILKKVNVTNQAMVDRHCIEQDGTENKSTLGANAILGVSLAAAVAGAAERKKPLYKHLADLAGNSNLRHPVPFFNVINGGSHAGNALDFQEFMIAPTGAKSFSEAMDMGMETYHHLRLVIKKEYGSAATAVGDEGGFAPNVDSPRQALKLISEAIHVAGYTGRIMIAMDVAASEFYKNGRYEFRSEDPNKKHMTSDELAEYYRSLIREYPIISIEDPFDQDDWDAWSKFTASVKGSVQVVGDDLTVTNPKRIQMAIDRKACTALLLKVNQIGTVTQAVEAHNLAKKAGWGTMVSHRSGETEDTFIADLVVGLGCGQIKSGAPCRSERVAKYNRLLHIEVMDGLKAFAGQSIVRSKSRSTVTH